MRRRAAERSSSPCSEPWRHDPAFPGRLSGRRSLTSLPWQGRRGFLSGKESETPYNMGGRGHCYRRRTWAGALLASGRSLSLSRGSARGRAGHFLHMEWLRERLPVMPGKTGSGRQCPGLRGAPGAFFLRGWDDGNLQERGAFICGCRVIYAPSRGMRGAGDGIAGRTCEARGYG